MAKNKSQNTNGKVTKEVLRDALKVVEDRLAERLERVTTTKANSAGQQR